MTTFIADAFKALFVIIAILALVLSVFAGTGFMVAYGPVAGFAVGALAVCGAISILGTIALLIENNRLLKQIADNLTPTPPARPNPPGSPDSPWEAQ
ncbi:MAG: Protein of unknown function (DUF1469) [Rhodobacteraceae bacterium HLUCCO07]|nr:MAG: Protein of unknown function (DUF1469) [Rhodobacteraceae bacterium HLUCCO07]